MLGDLPLEVASDAERLRVSCAIAMRGDAKLRVLRVRDGSLSRSRLARAAASHGRGCPTTRCGSRWWTRERERSASSSRTAGWSVADVTHSGAVGMWTAAAVSWIRTCTHAPNPTRFGWLVGKRIAQFSDGSCIFGWGFKLRRFGLNPPRGVEWDELSAVTAKVSQADIDAGSFVAE